MEDPVRKSIKEVDENTWLIGALILHHYRGYSDIATWYNQGDSWSYTLSDALNPSPPSVPFPADHPTIVLVYDVGGNSAVWPLGNSSFCKVELRVKNLG